MEHIQWIFSGIGTQILSAIGGLVVGGLEKISSFMSAIAEGVAAAGTMMAGVGAI